MTKRRPIATYPELLLFTVIACLVLALVYPKEMISDLISKEDANPDLKVAYLKNIVGKNPENMDAWHGLAEAYMRSGRFYDVNELLLELNKHNPEFASTIGPKMRLSIAKVRLYSAEEGTREWHNALSETRRVLRELIEASKDKSELEAYSREAVELDSQELAIDAVKKLLAIDNENQTHWLKRLYTMSLAVSDIRGAIGYARKLIEDDRENRLAWLEKVYGHSLELSDYGMAITYAKRLSEQDMKNRIEWLKELHKLTLQISELKAALEYARTLSREDSAKRIGWLEECFRIALAIPDRELMKKYAKLIAQEAKDDRVKWLERLAQFSHQEGDYEMSSRFFAEAMEGSSGDERKRFFLEALKVLQAGNMPDEAASLGTKHEDEFIDDEEVMSFLLKLYLSANDMKSANRLSRKLGEQK